MSEAPFSLSESCGHKEFEARTDYTGRLFFVCDVKTCDKVYGPLKKLDDNYEK